MTMTFPDDPDFLKIKNGKPLMGIDFDGTISEYRHGWEGPCVSTDEWPIPGAFKFLEEAVQYFSVVIFSARCNYPEGMESIKAWFTYHGLALGVREALHYLPGKPPFMILIDDRATQFDGSWSEMPPPQILHKWKPWYAGMVGWARNKK